MKLLCMTSLLVTVFSPNPLPAFGQDQPSATATTPAIDQVVRSHLLSVSQAKANTPPRAGTYGGGGAYRPVRAGTDAVSLPIIRFSDADAQTMGSLEEDLNVMSFILEKELSRALGEGSPVYKMGIPILLKPGSRLVEGMYLEGFGVLFTLQVGFPLLAPEIRPAEKREPAATSDWEDARQKLYGRSDEAGDSHWYSEYPSTPAYDAEQVDALKTTLINALKNAANIRTLKGDEFITVAVLGTESLVGKRTASDSGASAGAGLPGTGAGGRQAPAPGDLPLNARIPSNQSRRMTPERPVPGSGQGTVLTVRVIKSDADAFAKGRLSTDEFRNQAAVHAYVGGRAVGSGNWLPVYTTAPVEVR